MAIIYDCCKLLIIKELQLAAGHLPKCLIFNGLLHTARFEKQFALESGILLLETLGERIRATGLLVAEGGGEAGHCCDDFGDELECLFGRHSVFLLAIDYRERDGLSIIKTKKQ